MGIMASMISVAFAVHVEDLIQSPFHAVGMRVRWLVKGWKHVELALQKSHITKHVTLSFRPDVGTVTQVAHRWAYHVT